MKINWIDIGEIVLWQAVGYNQSGFSRSSLRFILIRLWPWRRLEIGVVGWPDGHTYTLALLYFTAWEIYAIEVLGVGIGLDWYSETGRPAVWFSPPFTDWIAEWVLPISTHRADD